MSTGQKSFRITKNEVKGMIDMARKDNKGRNLKTGEYQRSDGRYEYRYKDEITGKRNSVYAADLASLREMEKKINKDMDELLITDASVKKLTVNTLFERYMATKNIKERTKKIISVCGITGYEILWEIFVLWILRRLT